jgi:hypothetical protein
VSEQLYVKRGRRYHPWGNGDHWGHDCDAMEAGTCRLIHCPEPGHYRQRSIVSPDAAAWVAAAMVAEHAMQEAIAARAIAAPQVAPYTPKQLRLIEQFRRDMAAAGGLTPIYWTHSTPGEIVRAGIDAVRKLDA